MTKSPSTISEIPGMAGTGFCSIEGAQPRAIPVVGWAQAITGQPPAGGSRSGAMIMAETAIGFPSGEVER